MAQYICEVCQYVHDEDKLKKNWENLLENWTCPLCSSPKSVFRKTEQQTKGHNEDRPKTLTASYICEVCQYIYDEEKENKSWEDLPKDWVCPLCSSPKSVFKKIAAEQNKSSEEKININTTVSDIIVGTMINWGIKFVFGMVGHSNLGLAEAIRKRTETGDIHFIGVRHEGAAAFAASAYGKLTGKPAACLSIAGPGATNLLTGLWDAKVDRIPILALTGQIDIQFFGPGNFQEIDLSKAFESVTTWSQPVLPYSNYAELVNLALKNAIQKRDVAHLIFPNHVQEIKVPEGTEASSPEGRINPIEISPPAESLDKAIQMINKAQKPAIIVGHGARFSMDSVIQFAEKLNIPVITTFKAKGLIPDHHPLACGVLGRSGNPISAYYMAEADLLMVLGASFSKHTGIMQQKPIIQIDFDPLILGKFHAVTNPIWGEIGKTISLMYQRIDQIEVKPDCRNALAEHWRKWRKEKQLRASKDNGKGLNSALIFESLSRLVPNDAVIAVDVGNNTYSFGRYFESTSQSVIMSGYLGSIGFGYPAAIGAWAGAPNRPIFAITGDGGFGQYLGELTTATKYKIPIKHILLNNNELGKISKEQRNENKVVWSTELHNPNFAKFAENCGALGIRVTQKEELDKMLARIIKHDGPALLEIISDSELI
jgi:pyruvate oxidase